MKITIEILTNLNACNSGLAWFRATHPEGIDHDDLARQLMEEHSDWAYWLISRLLTPEQTATWADYSASYAAADEKARALVIDKGLDLINEEAK